MISRLERLWRRWPRHRIAVLACLSSLLLLVGCVGATDTRVTLYDGERWKLEVRLTITPEEMASLAMDEAGFEQYMTNALEAQYGNWGSLCRDWRKERDGENLVYILSCEGQGWQRLSGLLGGQVQSVEKDKVHFTYGPVMMGRSHTLRLTGGKVTSSNADEVKGGTAVWYNLVGAGQARATLSTARRSPLPCPFALGLGALLVPVALCLSRGRNRV